MAKVSVIGAGAFGTALAVQLSRAGNKVRIWVYEEKVRDEINRLHQNLTYLADIKLSSGIIATNSLEEAYQFSEIVFLAPPIFALRKLLPREDQGKIFVCASKGIEKDSHKLASQIVEEVVSGDYSVAAVSGPSFAKEVAGGLDSKVVLAGSNRDVLEKVRKLIATDNFKVEFSDDAVGVELGGALKNVLAILAGMAAGATLGKDYQAAVFTEGLREMVDLGKKLGAKEASFYTVAGLGDLFLTCTSDQSRNFTFGYRLGSGDKVDEALKTKSVIEGAGTAESVYHLGQKLGIQTPLFYNVYATIYEAKPPKKALEDIWQAI
ncbi:MAG TPA: NAD(P)H-dependent glycerol-3-phosphate dehydrogenase [Candidatus Nanoarchaeia archaeon]